MSWIDSLQGGFRGCGSPRGFSSLPACLRPLFSSLHRIDPRVCTALRTYPNCLVAVSARVPVSLLWLRLSEKAAVIEPGFDKLFLGIT